MRESSAAPQFAFISEQGGKSPGMKKENPITRFDLAGFDPIYQPGECSAAVDGVKKDRIVPSGKRNCRANLIIHQTIAGGQNIFGQVNNCL